MALRADQVELTRRAVIDAVVELSSDPDGGRITVAEVARRSGISQATIYRHFPSREDLISAAALERLRETGRAHGGVVGMDDHRSYFRALWGELAENPVLARQAVVSEAGRELRRARFTAHQPLVEQSLADLGLDPSSADGQRLAACLYVLESAHAFLDLHDRQGLSPDEAVDAVTWGQRTLLRALGCDPARLRIRLAGADDTDHEGAPR